MKRRREWRGWRVELASLILPKGWHARRARLAPRWPRATVALPPDVPREPLPLAGKQLILTGQITEDAGSAAAGTVGALEADLEEVADALASPDVEVQVEPHVPGWDDVEPRDDWDKDLEPPVES